MLYTTSVMDDQVAKCNVRHALLLDNVFNVKDIKAEHREDDFEDEKIDISETAIIIDKAEIQSPLIHDKIKGNDISTALDNIKTELSLSEVQCNMINDNLKIEELVSADNIKIEFNNGLLYCEECHAYCEDYCGKCGMLVHILNRPLAMNVNNRSIEELPNDKILKIHNYSGEFRIFALKVVPAGVRFGPFTGLDRAERAWRIKGGNLVAHKDESKNLNWMRYINPAKNISEQNLQVFQYEQNLYYQSTRQIQEGDELLVYFGNEYEDSLNRNVEMDFVPTTEQFIKDAFACTFCCLGFSSKLYLAKHRIICPENAAGEFQVEELIQCPSCKIHLDQKEYYIHHVGYCEKIDRKYILPAAGNRMAQVYGHKIRQHLMHKCQQCRYTTKYKGDLKNHTNQHYEVKMYKCGVCCRRFNTKEVLRLHVEHTQMCAGGKKDRDHSTGVYMNAHIKVENFGPQDEMKQFKCSLCEFRTKYKRNLKIHMKTKHLKEVAYQCETYDYKASLKSQLKRHIGARHLKQNKYKCDMCDYKANRNFHLKTHMQTRHLKEFKYMCGKCNYKANLKSQLKAHIETRHLKEFKYNCDTCDYKTSRKTNLNTHIEIMHLKKFKYKCDMCEYKAHVKSHLKVHIKTMHLKEFNYNCDSCDYKTNWKLSLKKHINTRHLKEFKYTCEACDYKTNWKTNLKKHIDTRHLEEFKYKCDLCDYKTNWKPTFEKHLESRHSSEFKYKCATCEYKSNRKDKLKMHIETRHLKEFKYKCDICDYKANFKYNLKRHIEVRHLKEFKYKCDKCEYKTIWRSELKKHLDTKHLKVFKYKCDTCDYKTNRKSYLDTHTETKHLKEFKYKCDTCEYKTNWKSYLKTHIEGKHLKVLNYKCHMCDYKANLQSLLNVHVKTKHLNIFKHKCDTCNYKTNWKSDLKKHVERRHTDVLFK